MGNQKIAGALASVAVGKTISAAGLRSAHVPTRPRYRGLILHRGWQAFVLLTLLLTVSQAPSQSTTPDQFCYTRVGTTAATCFDTRQDAEAQMRSDPAFGGAAPLLERFDTPSAFLGVTPSSPNVTLYYLIKPRAPVVSYTMYAAELSGSAGGTGGFGCTPSAPDPNAAYSDWCARESDLVTRAQQQWLASELAGCTLIGTTLQTDNAGNAAPLIERDTNNAQRGIIQLGAGYGSQYRRYRTTAQCAGEQAPRERLWNALRHTTFLCASGFEASESYGRVDGAFCEPVNKDVAAITGPLQQCGSCAASPNPIYPATGEKARQEPDFEFAGRSFVRYYHSLGQLRTNPNFALGWTHTYSDRVFGFAGAASVGVVSASGYFESFVAIGNGRYRGENSANRTLEAISEGDAVWRLRDADGELREFDFKGLLIAQRDPADPVNAVTIEYADDLPTRVIDGVGRALRLEYADGMLARIVKPDGVAVGYGYDAASNLISVDYGNAQIKQYHYHEAGLADPKFVNHLTGITAETGRRFASFTYDAKGRVTVSRVLGTPNEVTFASYPTPTTATIITANGLVCQYTMQPGLYRHIEEVSDADGEETMTFDPQGRPQTRTDKRGVVAKFEYTDAHRSATIEAFGTPEQRRTETSHDPATNLPTERRVFDASGALVAKHSVTYNARQQVTSTTATDPTTNATRTATFTYCEQADVNDNTCPLVGQLGRVDGPRSDVNDVLDYRYRMADAADCATAPTTCAYRAGDVWTMTNALGQVIETLRYDGAARPLSMKDANGITTDVVYSPRGWPTARIVRGDNDGSELDDQFTRFTYTDNGLPETMQLPGGELLGYAYDAAHRLTGIADNLGNTIAYTLNGVGERVGEDIRDSANALRKTLTRSYDLLGRLHTQTDALLRTTTYTYDAEGDLDTMTDALGRVMNQDVDALGRVTRSVQDAVGATAIQAQTAYRYDALDRVTRVTDPKGLHTVYAYTGFGEHLQLSSPDTGTSHFSYDSAGNRSNATDANGKTVNYAYDALNRLTAMTYPQEPALNVAYVYDTAQSDCSAGETFLTGRLARMTDHSGSTTWCYDRFGQMTRNVQRTQGKPFAQRWSYQVSGRLSTTTYPDGAVVDYVYDAMGRVVEIGVTALRGTRQQVLRAASYHPFGPVAQWTYGNGRVMNRTLNQNYQPGIVQDTAPGGISLGYAFDEVGNLKTLRNGDQSDPPKRIYGYDGLNRLTKAVRRMRREAPAKRMPPNVMKLSYRYNGKGERVRKTGSDEDTVTLYDEAGRWLGDYTVNGQPMQQAIWLDDLPVGLIVGAGSQ